MYSASLLLAFSLFVDTSVSVFVCLWVHVCVCVCFHLLD